MKNNILTSMIVSWALLWWAQAQSIAPPAQETKNTTHANIPTAPVNVPALLAATQSNVNSVYSSTWSWIPTQHIAYLNDQINKGSWSIDAQLEREMEKQRGDWARSSWWLIKPTSDGKLTLWWIFENINTTYAPGWNFKISITHKF